MDTATTEIYTLSLHDALPISRWTCFASSTIPCLIVSPSEVCDVSSANRRFMRSSAQNKSTAVGRVFASTDRKSTRLNSSHPSISYAVFCLKKKNNTTKMYYLIQHLSSSCFFFFYGYGDHRDLHSFPTRRSSDLEVDLLRFLDHPLLDSFAV